MQTTLKRIDVGSAFRVGIVLYGLLFAIFGLLLVAFQSFLINLFARSVTLDMPNMPNNATFFLGTGILSLLCFYGVGVVAAAFVGGIQFAVGAWCYNRAADWVGGIKFQLETEDTGLLDDIERDLGKRKRGEGEL